MGVGVHDVLVPWLAVVVLCHCLHVDQSIVQVKLDIEVLEHLSVPHWSLRPHLGGLVLQSKLELLQELLDCGLLAACLLDVMLCRRVNCLCQNMIEVVLLNHLGDVRHQFVLQLSGVELDIS